MLTFLLLAAAHPTPPAPPATAMPGETVIREVVSRKSGDAKTDEKVKQERREIIVIRDGKETAAAATPERRIRVVDVTGGKGEERREVRILREPGAPGTRIAMLSCDDGAKVDSEATDKDGKKTRVMICAKGGSSNVSKIQQLRDAAKRIEGDTNLSPEARTRVVTAINEAIAKLPANE